MFSNVGFPYPILVTGAVEDVNFTLPAPGVLSEATAPTGFAVTVHNYSQPADGCARVQLATNGALSLVPAADFFGNCSFTFIVLDDVGAPVKATVVVTIGEGQSACFCLRRAPAWSSALCV